MTFKKTVCCRQITEPILQALNQMCLMISDLAEKRCSACIIFNELILKCERYRNINILKLLILLSDCIKFVINFVMYKFQLHLPCQRPYHVENTGSRPITEVKQHRA